MLHAKGKGPISDYYTKVKTKLNDLNKVSENKSSVNRYNNEGESSATRSSSRSKINPGTGARLGDTASQVWDFFGKKSSPKGSSETKTKIEGNSPVSSNEGTSSAEAAETSSFGPQKSGLGVELSSAFSENPLSLDMNSPESLPTLSTKSDAFSKGMGRKNKKKVVSAETLGKSIKEKQNAEAIVKMNPKGAQKPPSLPNETGFSNTMQKQNVSPPQKPSRRQEKLKAEENKKDAQDSKDFAKFATEYDGAPSGVSPSQDFAKTLYLQKAKAEGFTRDEAMKYSKVYRQNKDNGAYRYEMGGGNNAAFYAEKEEPKKSLKGLFNRKNK